MNVTQSNVTKIHLTDVDKLDPITVYLEDIAPARGKITIECYGQAWSSYWGGTGSDTMSQFFCSCDKYYLSKNLSSIEPEIYDIEKIRDDAGNKSIECYRDDPWNDYKFMTEMYGPDTYGWDSIPKMLNPEYDYLCRIILAVQAGLKEIDKES